MREAESYKVSNHCFYCKEVFALQSYYIMKKATKPRHSPYRWLAVHKCCESCYGKGAKIQIDNFK